MNLLLISDEEKRHYCLIKSMSRLLSSQSSTDEHVLHYCPRCLNHFTTQEKLATHKEYCSAHEAVKMETPEAGTTLNTLPAKDGDLRLSASNACLPKTEISVFVTECVFFTPTCYKLLCSHCMMCYTVRQKKCSSLFWYEAIIVWFSQFIMIVVQN